MPSILLAGQGPALDQFASACSAAGLAVTVLTDGARHPGGDPARVRGVRKSAHARGRFDLAAELTLAGDDGKRARLSALDRLGAGIPLFTNTLSATLAEQSAWVKHPGRLCGIGVFPGAMEGGLLEFAASPGAPGRLLEAARELARSLGKEALFVRDLPGMVFPRIRCALTNEACFALQERIASPAGIDEAMMLGANHPDGPVAWAERAGAAHVLEVMEALHRFYGEERYRPAPLLRRAAALGSLGAAALEAASKTAGSMEAGDRPSSTITHGTTPDGT
jgi:3-hydroxybutyryl-CoA dehydrogenase